MANPGAHKLDGFIHLNVTSETKNRVNALCIEKGGVTYSRIGREALSGLHPSFDCACGYANRVGGIGRLGFGRIFDVFTPCPKA